MLRELNLSRAKRLPVILAAEGGECGLACLAMIAKYWGHDVDLNGLRQKFSLSMSGATLRTIIEQAAELSLSARPIRTDLSGLKAAALPAVLHWNLNHFVVLESVSTSHVVVHDPALGRRKINFEEVSGQFTGVLVEFEKSKAFQKVTAQTRPKLTSLWSDSRGLLSAILHILALTLALQVVMIAMPFQLQLVIDQVLGTNDHDLLRTISLGFCALVVIQCLIELIRSWSIAALGQLLSYQLIRNLVNHLIYLPSSWFEKRNIGDILSRIQSTAPIKTLVSTSAPTVVLDGAIGLIAGGILFLYSAQLAVIVYLGTFLTLLATLAIYPIQRHRLEEQINASAKESTYLMETIRAATIIKLMGAESNRIANWKNLFADTINSGFSVLKYNIGLEFLRKLCVGLQFSLVIYLAADEIIHNTGFTVGMLFAFLSFKVTFVDKTNKLIDQLFQLKLLGLHLERIGDIVQTEAESSTHSMFIEKPNGAIDIRGVHFRYGAGDKFVFKNLNLRIEPGEFVALVGKSGAGKSTLVKLILGLYAPDEGEIFLDGQAASAVFYKAWRQHVGFVAQDDRLLAGSVADNIAFFDPEMSMEDVVAAAKAAQVHEEILQMPMKYQSLVGDMGSSLSGGQRQRILLARALYRKPSILILDEGTANLDPETEQGVVDIVTKLRLTRIVVAHRPALIDKADRVIQVTSAGASVLSER